MAEEVRFFVRTLLYLVPVTIVYWIVSTEPAGTALLVALVGAVAAFAVVAILLVPGALGDLRPRGGTLLGRAVSAVDRAVGFHERTDAAPPLEGGPELVPIGSPWPIVAAAALVVVGLGLIFGPWLLGPGIALLAFAGLGWLTQLDRA